MRGDAVLWGHHGEGDSLGDRFVIAFLPRSERILISWFPSPSVAILEPKKTNSTTVAPKRVNILRGFRKKANGYSTMC